MDNTGKIIVALGLAGLTGAAIQSSIDTRKRESDRICETQRRLKETIKDQELEIDRLRREQNRITEKMNQTS